MHEWVAPRLPLRWTNPEQPPFVGRSDESVRLQAAWSEARAGRGRTTFVLGEPGVGKSRLVGEACRRWHQEGAVVAVGAAVPEFGAPYEPLVEPLRVLAPLAREMLDDDAPVAVVDAALGRHPDEEDAGIGQGRLFDSIGAVLRATASAGPLVLVLEDLHWADEGTVRLLTRIVETTTDSALLIVATARDTVPDRSSTLSGAITRLLRLDGVERIDLSTLTEADLAVYLQRRIGTPADALREPARLLRELTGGNPYLVRETWRQVLAAGGGDGVEMPESVNDLLRERIAALAEASQRVLQHAAVLGQEVELTELVAVCDRPAEETLEGVDAAVESGLLEPPRLVHEAYRFPHAIARQAVLDQLSAVQLLGVHARVAETLRMQAPNAPRLVQRLAHHYSAARALGYTPQAVQYLTQSAELANSRLAHEEAARLFEQASTFESDHERADELRLSAAESWTLTADFARARTLLEPVMAEGTPSQRRRAALAYEEALWRPGLGGRRAVELLTEALQHDLDADARIRLSAAYARALAFTGQIDQATEVAERAVAEARTVGDPALLATALRYSVSVSIRPAELHHRLAQAAELRTLGVPGEDAYNAGANFRVLACYVVGDRPGLDVAEMDLVETAPRSGAYWNYWIYCIRFGRALVEGRLGQAREAGALVRQADLDFKSDRDDGVFALQSYMLRRETRDITRVASLLTGEEPTQTHWAAGLLALYTEFEMRTPARRVLDDLLRRAADHSHDSADWPAWLGFAAEAATWLEDRDAAALIRSFVGEYSGVNLLAGWLVAPFGAADRYLGELDSLCGVGDPDALFGSALALDEGMGAHLHVAYTRLAWARHLRRVDGSVREIATLEDAARIPAEREGWERVLWMLRRQRHGRGSRADGLSEREIEVIRLLAEGCSNRDIAQRLFISEHTAANHVRSILLKTNSTNRTQAAGYARAQALIS